MCVCVCNVHVHTYSLYNVHLKCGSLKITIYLLINSLIYLFSIVLKKIFISYR